MKAEREGWSEDEMRQEARRIRWFRPLNGSDVVTDLSDLIAKKRKYRCILADPPYYWDTAGGKKGASTASYPVMTYEELRALPVEQVAADDAFLFLWSPPSLLPEALKLMAAWGFQYKTNATWDKLSGFGRGAYFRTVHEHLLVGVRPRTPTHFIDDNIESVIRIERSRIHSEKPPEVHALIERAVGGQFLELFARTRRKGWDCYGNQLPSDDEDYPQAAN
jgi:N6-adenosine-specific RNA methylase IME4